MRQPVTLTLSHDNDPSFDLTQEIKSYGTFYPQTTYLLSLRSPEIKRNMQFTMQLMINSVIRFYGSYKNEASFARNEPHHRLIFLLFLGDLEMESCCYLSRPTPSIFMSRFNSLTKTPNLTTHALFQNTADQITLPEIIEFLTEEVKEEEPTTLLDKICPPSYVDRQSDNGFIFTNCKIL